jgi:hypothetical protein
MQCEFCHQTLEPDAPIYRVARWDFGAFVSEVCATCCATKPHPDNTWMKGHQWRTPAPCKRCGRPEVSSGDLPGARSKLHRASTVPPLPNAIHAQAERRPLLFEGMQADGLPAKALFGPRRRRDEAIGRDGTTRLGRPRYRRARLSPLAAGAAFGSGVGSGAASNFPSAARSGSRRGARGNRSSSMARRIAAAAAASSSAVRLTVGTGRR